MTEKIRQFILDKSTVTITSAVSIMVCAFLGGLAWGSITWNLEDLKKEVRAISRNNWTIYDMDSWTKDLRYENRDANLKVPCPNREKYVKNERNKHE